MSSAAHDLQALRHRLSHRHAIGRQLRRGGMGAVYRARDLQLDRPLAINVLPMEFASQPQLRERFLRETRSAAGQRLQLPGEHLDQEGPGLDDGRIARGWSPTVTSEEDFRQHDDSLPEPLGRIVSSALLAVTVHRLATVYRRSPEGESIVRTVLER